MTGHQRGDVPDLCDHLQGCLSDRFHGHCREPVGQHGPYKKARIDLWVKDRRMHEINLGSCDKSPKESQRYKRRRSNCKTLRGAGLWFRGSGDMAAAGGELTFPMAAVVLPAESRASVLSLTSSPMPDISAIPPALSEIGP